MKRHTLFVTAGVMLTAFALLQTRAAENTWVNGTGNFLWDSASANWTSPTVWADGDDAIFGATGAGAVTLGSSVTVENQTFNAPGYTIVGDGNILTLAGTTPTITVNADSTNGASIYGTNGLTIQGTGVLTLQGDAPNLDANHYTGGTYVRGGTLMLGARGALANGTSYAVDSIEALDAGATLKFDTLFNGTTYSSPAPYQIAAHSTAFPSHLHMTGGTFDFNNEPKAQDIPIPDGTGLIVNNGTTVQSGLIMVVDGHDHEFSGVIADGGPLVGDNSGQGPGRQIGIVSFASTISTNGSVWTLSGPNTYSGSTRLQFGGSIKLAGNGTLGFPTPNGLTGPLRIYGPSYLDLNGHNQTIALMTSGDAGGKIFNSAVGTVSTLTFGYGNETVTSRNAGMQFIDNPGTGGILAMTKIGNACIQTLSGTNTYSGDTTVSEGTLALAAISAVSPNSAFRLNTTPSANAKLALTYTGTANVRQLWIDGVQQPNGVYGAGTPGIDPTSTGTITVNGPSPNTWTDGSGNFLWDLSSANWTSPAIWADGDDAIFGVAGAGAVTLGSSVTVENQTFNASGYTIVGDGNALTLAGATPTITVNADSTNGASIYGTDGLTVQGIGVLTLQGDAPNLDANHYTGGTYVRGGTLMLGARGANANGTSYAVDSVEALDAGATMKFDTPFDGTSYTTPALNQIASHSTAFPSHLHMTGGTFDLNNENRSQHVPIPDGTGLIVNNGTTVQSGLIMVVDGHDHEFSGVIADGGPLVGDNSGQGPGRQIGIVSFAATISTNGSELTLSGSNTYSGSTRLQFGGSIKLAGNGTIGFPTPNGLTGPLRIYGPSHLDLNGHNQTIALMTSGDAGGKIFNSAVGTVSTLTFGYGNEQAARDASMQYIDNPGTGGTLALTKIGDNCAQTLSGTNTYSGDTTVSEGTLNFSKTSAVSPNSAFRLNTTPSANARLKLTYTGTANVRQLWIDGVQQPNGVYGASTPGIDPTSTGTITVTGNNQISLGFSQSGNTLTFSWLGSYKLQSKTNNIAGTWFDYPGGSASPVNITIDPAQGSVFFRLSSP